MSLKSEKDRDFHTKMDRKTGLTEKIQSGKWDLRTALWTLWQLTRENLLTTMSSEFWSTNSLLSRRNKLFSLNT